MNGRLVTTNSAQNPNESDPRASSIHGLETHADNSGPIALGLERRSNLRSEAGAGPDPDPALEDFGQLEDRVRGASRPSYSKVLQQAAATESERGANAGKGARKRIGPIVFLRDVVVELFKIAVVVMVLKAYVLQASSVEGQSMEPTIHDGDYLLVEKVSASVAHMPDVISDSAFVSWLPRIERGDIVVLASPENGNSELVKRVVAVEDDFLFFYDGQVWVNGRPVDEFYVSDETRKKLFQVPGKSRTVAEADIPGGDYEPSEDRFDRYTRESRLHELGVKIPVGCLFVIGDNRAPGASNDSRAWARTRISNGPGEGDAAHLWVTKQHVHGRVIARLRWPWDYSNDRPLVPR